MLLAAEIFTALATVVVPIVVICYFCLKLNNGWKWICLGAACSILIGLFVRLSLLTWLNSMSFFENFTKTNPTGYALLNSFLLALAYAGGSWLIMQVIMKGHDAFMEAAAYGAGLGTVESILLVGINSLQLFLATQVLIAPEAIFFSGLERLCMMVLDIGWALWIMKNVRKHERIWFYYAFFMQWALFFLTTMMNAVWNVPLWGSALLLCGCSAFMVWEIVREHNTWTMEKATRAEKSRKIREARQAYVDKKKASQAAKAKPADHSVSDTEAAESLEQAAKAETKIPDTSEKTKVHS